MYANAIKGFYDNLYVDADSFRKLKNGKYVFQYYLDEHNNIILRGWKACELWGRKFKSDFVLDLKSSSQSKLPIWKTNLFRRPYSF